MKHFDLRCIPLCLCDFPSCLEAVRDLREEDVCAGHWEGEGEKERQAGS